MSSLAPLNTALSAASAPGNSNQGMSGLTAFTSGIQAFTGLAGNIANYSAANQESKMQEAQAALESQQATLDAEQKARTVTQFAGQQAMDYAASGVQIQGSPVQVLQSTLNLGQQEINQIKVAGQARANLLSLQASQTRAQGRAALIGGAANFLNTVGTVYTKGQRSGLFGGPAATPLHGIPESDDFIPIRGQGN